MATTADAAAITEVQVARQRLAQQRAPDLPALVALAIEHDRLATRISAIPPELCGVWVRLGQPRRGMALANSQTEPRDRASALMEMVRAYVATRRLDQAEQTARSITDSSTKAQALEVLAQAYVADGQLNQAEQTARSITDPPREARALKELVPR